jgi:hypothetical protein
MHLCWSIASLRDSHACRNECKAGVNPGGLARKARNVQDYAPKCANSQGGLGDIIPGVPIFCSLSSEALGRSRTCHRRTSNPALILRVPACMANKNTTTGNSHNNNKYKIVVIILVMAAGPIADGYRLWHQLVRWTRGQQQERHSREFLPSSLSAQRSNHSQILP